MPDPDFVDFYELLQISPNAERETIERVHKMLAVRFHPDNPETGNVDQFILLNRAYEMLTDPEARAVYDEAYHQHDVEPIPLFELREFAMGVDGEANRRMGILCLLYNRRRANPDDAGLSILEFEKMMSIPREHLMFTMWYLREQSCVKQNESSDFEITGAGVDYVESHLPTNRILYKLLKASESGSTRAGAKESAQTREGGA
jgi:curved DNA-binding protein CbpA